MATITGSTSLTSWTFKLVTTEGTANIANNTSPLTVDVYLGRYSSSGSYAEGGTFNISVSVTGCTTKTFTYDNKGKKIEIAAGGWFKLGSVTFDAVPHNADGKKTVTVSASFTFTYSPDKGSASGSVKLADIVRLIHINRNGTWKDGIAWVNSGGTWKKGIAWAKVNGSWKRGGA